MYQEGGWGTKIGTRRLGTPNDAPSSRCCVNIFQVRGWGTKIGTRRLGTPNDAPPLRFGEHISPVRGWHVCVGGVKLCLWGDWGLKKEYHVSHTKW